MKIPCFEWKTDINKGTKTAEYYLNSYYHKKKNNSSRISLNNNKGKKNDSNGSNIIDDSIINIEDLPFNFSEHIMSMGEEEKVIRILKNQIVNNKTNSDYHYNINVKDYFDVTSGRYHHHIVGEE